MAYARTWRLLAAATVLAVTGGCGVLGGGGADAADAAPVAASAAPEESYDPSFEEATPEPEPTTASPTPGRKKPKATGKPAAEPTETEDPNNFTEPECAEHEGRNVSKRAAESALRAAAGRTYWPGSAPKLKVPSRLVLATAWHESGWQSNIVNCDGGRGLMQVMPETESFINERFEKAYDAHDHRQNATLGANYLAWLTKAFGDQYFKGDYDLSASKCRTARSMCLLNMVIAGYNVGRGTVDEAYDSRKLPAPAYVASVRALMKSCYCDRY